MVLIIAVKLGVLNNVRKKFNLQSLKIFFRKKKSWMKLEEYLIFYNNETNLYKT